MILFDSCSSHSFVDTFIAEELSDQVVYGRPITVMVANDHKITSGGECVGVQWRIQTYEFC